MIPNRNIKCGNVNICQDLTNAVIICFQPCDQFYFERVILKLDFYYTKVTHHHCRNSLPWVRGFIRSATLCLKSPFSCQVAMSCQDCVTQRVPTVNMNTLCMLGGKSCMHTTTTHQLMGWPHTHTQETHLHRHKGIYMMMQLGPIMIQSVFSEIQ